MSEPNNRQLKKLQETIKESAKPLLCVGGGCMLSQVSDKILEFSERIKAPFVTTLLGIGAVPTDHKNCLGMIGQSGLFIANKAAEHADLIIVLGARLADRATGNAYTFANNAKIAHIDIDPAEIGKNHDAYIPIVGDLDITLAKILDMDIDRNANADWFNDIDKWKEYQDSTGVSGDEGLDPQMILQSLSDRSDNSVVITTDVGQHQVWTGRFYKTKAACSFITSGGLGTMGFSLPSAIGASLGNPHKRGYNCCW